MYPWKVLRQEFWYILQLLPGLEIQLEQSWDNSPALEKKWFKVARHDKLYAYFFSKSNLWLVVKAMSFESGDVDSISTRCWNVVQL